MHPLAFSAGILLVAWPLARATALRQSRIFASGFALAVLLWVTLALSLGIMRRPLLPALLVLVWWEVQAVGVMVGDVPSALPSIAARLRRLGGAAGLIVAALLPPLWLLPRAPEFGPSGPYRVGVTDLYLADSARTGLGGSAWLLPLRLWYPAEPDPRPRRAARHRAPAAFESDLAARLPGAQGGWIVRGLTRSALPLIAEPRLSTRQRQWPVVVLSHGVPGSPALLATLATELASHGFVVATPEHVGASLGTVLPDERYVPPRPEGWEVAVDGAWLEQYAADGRLVREGLRALAAADSSGRFTGRLAVDSLAWVGSGVAATAAACEGSAATCVAWDGGRPAEVTDLEWWSPPLLQWAGLGGSLPPRQAQARVHGAVLRFLQAWLRHEPADLDGLVEPPRLVRVVPGQPAG